MILHTTTGGMPWVFPRTGTTVDLKGVSFIDSSAGVAVGGPGFSGENEAVILCTTDGGMTWGRQWSEAGLDLQDVSCTVDGTAVAVGSGGTILRMTAATSVQGDPPGRGIEPREIALAQNYPNPFNPTTTIECVLTRHGYATLAVYNTLGEEVKVLFSGQLPGGKHLVHWDASGFPSGVYFYRLSAGEYVQTRKMVLMR